MNECGNDIRVQQAQIVGFHTCPALDWLVTFDQSLTKRLFWVALGIMRFVLRRGAQRHS